MKTERILWAQQSGRARTPLVWEDVAVPKVKHGIPPRLTPITVGEWGESLAKNAMVGVWRAYTDGGRVVQIEVRATTSHDYTVKELSL
jgi:hypothetical protein